MAVFISGSRPVPLFNGTNSYILCPQPAGMPTGSAARTLECWFKLPTHPAAYKTLVGYGPNANYSMFTLQLTNVVGNLANAIGITTYSSDLTIPCNNYEDGVFHHFAGVYTGSTVHMYIDGKFMASSALTVNTTAALLRICVDPSLASFTNAYMCEVKLWNVAKTSQQIHDERFLKLTGSESNLIAYLPLDENSNDNIRNRVTNELCTVVGGLTWETQTLPRQEYTQFGNNYATKQQPIQIPSLNQSQIQPTGKSSKCLFFPGVDGGCVDCGTFNPFTSSAFTIEFWHRSLGVPIRFQEITSNYNPTIISKRDGWSSTLTHWDLKSWTTTQYMQFGTSGTSRNIGWPMVRSGWEHVALTQNGSNLLVYKKGALLSTLDVVPLGGAPTARIGLGGNAQSGGVEVHHGYISNVRLWSKCCTQAEIQQNMFVRIKPQANLEAYWPMDDGVGTQVTDISGNNRHGTITGVGPVWVSENEIGYDVTPNDFKKKKTFVFTPHTKSENKTNIASNIYIDNFNDTNIYRIRNVGCVYTSNSVVVGKIINTDKCPMINTSVNWYHPSKKLYMEFKARLSGSASSLHRMCGVRMMIHKRNALSTEPIFYYGYDSYQTLVSGFQAGYNPVRARSGSFSNNTWQTCKLWWNGNTGLVTVQLDSSESASVTHADYLLTDWVCISPYFAVEGWYSTHICEIDYLKMTTF